MIFGSQRSRSQGWKMGGAKWVTLTENPFLRKSVHSNTSFDAVGLQLYPSVIKQDRGLLRFSVHRCWDAGVLVGEYPQVNLGRLVGIDSQVYRHWTETDRRTDGQS